MKKFLVILASVIVAAVTLSLTTSCKKDIEKAKSLIGTTWVNAGNEISRTITFTSQTNFAMDTVEGDGTHKYTGIFIIAGDTITMNFDGSSLGPWSGKFTSDNEMTIESFVFKKLVL